MYSCRPGTPAPTHPHRFPHSSTHQLTSSGRLFLRRRASTPHHRRHRRQYQCRSKTRSQATPRPTTHTPTPCLTTPINLHPNDSSTRRRSSMRRDGTRRRACGGGRTGGAVAEVGTRRLPPASTSSHTLPYSRRCSGGSHRLHRSRTRTRTRIGPRCQLQPRALLPHSDLAQRLLPFQPYSTRLGLPPRRLHPPPTSSHPHLAAHSQRQGPFNSRSKTAPRLDLPHTTPQPLLPRPHPRAHALLAPSDPPTSCQQRTSPPRTASASGPPQPEPGTVNLREKLRPRRRVPPILSGSTAGRGRSSPRTIARAARGAARSSLSSSTEERETRYGWRRRVGTGAGLASRCRRDQIGRASCRERVS